MAGSLLGGIERVTGAAAQLVNEFVSGETVAAIVVTLSPEGVVRVEAFCAAELSDGFFGDAMPIIVRRVADALPQYAESISKKPKNGNGELN